MEKIKSFLVILFFLFLLFILDSRFSLLINGFLPKPFTLSCHTSLMALLYFEKRFSNGLYLAFFILGLIVDSYYYHTLGLAIILYPIIVYLVKKHNGLILLKTTRFLMLLAIVLIFEVGTYFLAVIYGLTNYPIDFEISYQLMPTLVFNSIVLILISPFFKSITE